MRRLKAFELLDRADFLYEALRLSPPVVRSWPPRGIFEAGGTWMKKALARIAGDPLPHRNPLFKELGYFKYGSALWASLMAAGLFAGWGAPVAVAAGVLVFYAVEAQWVFLFPLSIEGNFRPLPSSLRMTRTAGGTFRVMGCVLPLAAYMLLGGFFGKGFRRSWCLGCLAVLVWYLDLKQDQEGADGDL